jgi:hypothetical protein
MNFSDKTGRSHSYRSTRFGVQGVGLVGLMVLSSLAIGSQKPVQAVGGMYCQFTPDAIAQKETLRKAAVTGDAQAKQQYQALITDHAKALQTCRGRSWPQNMATWLRLYPCDANPGTLDEVFDRIVNRGYNQAYVEVFYDGVVLLPAAENKSPWVSVVKTPGYEQQDLLAAAIQKGRERGVKVYAWLFAMNFGYPYAQRSDRAATLARNGRGQTSLTMASLDDKDVSLEGDIADKAFIDPYNTQARQDFYQLVNATLKRRPDGILFDYIRYPRGIGGDSIADQPQDLWIYGEASQRALIERAQNNRGRDVIQQFLAKGSISEADFSAISKRYPQEKVPLWQGFKPPATLNRSQLQYNLWLLSVAHAMQGVLDFLNWGIYPAQRMGIPSGAVFFPGGNRTIRQGYDSRLQPWNRFPSSIQWHPMVYGACNDASCIVSEVQEVLRQAPSGTQVNPVLAGLSQQSFRNRPSLEVQMQAIRQVAPQITTISHFAYAWQEPQSDQTRRACRLTPQ